MEILAFEEQEHCTMFTVISEAGERVSHVVPHGVVEARMAEWNLPDDVDPLEVVLVQAHLHPGAADSDPYGDWYEEKRELLIAEVRKQRGKIRWGAGVDKERAAVACRMPPGLHEQVLEKARRTAVQARAQRKMAARKSTVQKVAERMRVEEQIAAGYQRMREERLADEHMAEMKRSQRAQGPPERRVER